MSHPARSDRAPIRVVHVVQNLNYGGMERLIADLATRADPEQFEAHVLALQYLGRFAEGLHDRVGLHLAEPMSRWSMLRPKALAAQFRALAPDVVHTHSGVWFKASYAARMAKVPLVIHTEHGQGRPDSRTDRFIERLASRNTDVVVAVSDVLAERMEAQRIAGPSRLRVIRNGIDVRRFAESTPTGALRRELRLAADTPIIGSVGRLEHIKGYDIMVAAFAELHRSWTRPNPPVLVLVGDGSERPALTELSSKLAVSDHIRFLGWRDDIATVLSAFSLFTMSSRSEGTSVSLLEAMAAGVCPVVTDVGGNRAVLGEGLCHRLVAPTDPTALSTAWIAALTDPVALAADARAALERVRTAWGIETMIRSYENVYRLSR